MNRRFWLHQLGVALGMGLLTMPLILYGKLSLQRPPQTALERTLFQGVHYRREFRATPRPMLVHILTIDLTAPGIKLLVTPEHPSMDGATIARTTSQFLEEFKLQVAVNASYFTPFSEETPWNYYPRTGDRVSPIGRTIANGISYATLNLNWVVLCISDRQRAAIQATGECPTRTTQAIAGNTLLLQQGQPVPTDPQIADRHRPYPRLSAAVNRTGTTLWLVAIDGKQAFYSEGATLPELTAILQELQVDAAINLDGGGSTTLVTTTPTGTAVLNAPIHAKIPMWERPVANHLGIYALPQISSELPALPRQP
ncbi:phosphodiester glycosidase family protein [Pantanalinema rosaneae CENA516]|uniref:phosphodiester glycosidase family protein n=1 Tax=Pantanalinema rosaneae TaxID=1620701 RepID=UPI003D6F6ACA